MIFWTTRACISAVGYIKFAITDSNSTRKRPFHHLLNCENVFVLFVWEDHLFHPLTQVYAPWSIFPGTISVLGTNQTEYLSSSNMSYWVFQWNTVGKPVSFL